MWIISDLHISDNFSFVDRSVIIKMLRHIQKGVKDSIIFNGDTFDFARTFTLPDGYKATKEELRYGLSHSIENAAEKMRLIVESNKEIFDLLELLISDGFTLVFLFGNHDSELRFSSVKKIIQDRIGAKVGENLFFDIRYIADGIVIEHGHQYDPENRIIYRDNDFYAEEYTFGYVSSKYFGNIVEKERRLPPNDASAGEYFLWVFRNFGFRSVRFIFQYFIYAFKVIARSGIFFRYKSKDSRGSLDAIPLMSSFPKTIKRLYLVQVSLFISVMIFIFLSLIFFPALLPYGLVSLCVSLIPLFGINNRKRLFYVLNTVSERLKELYQAEEVIFGHNHLSVSGSQELSYYSSIPFFDGSVLSVLKAKSGNIGFERIKII